VTTPVTGSIRVRYRYRATSSDSDSDLYQIVNLLYGNADRDVVSAAVSLRLAEDTDGNRNVQGYYPFTSLDDKYSSWATSRLYTAYLDYRPEEGRLLLPARYVAEHLARHAEVEVLTTCARDYVTWENELRAGVESINGLPVRRFPVAHPRTPELFAQHSATVFDQPHSLQDELTTRLAEGTSRRLYLVSVVTTVLLPATFVTGFFGMNTGGLLWDGDEYSHGTIYATLLCGAAVPCVGDAEGVQGVEVRLGRDRLLQQLDGGGGPVRYNRGAGVQDEPGRRPFLFWTEDA
jgi:hypothetical protein